jgi:sugar/nucleoside kinase (ribokinase family)
VERGSEPPGPASLAIRDFCFAEGVKIEENLLMDVATQRLDYVAFNIMLDDLVFPDGHTEMGVLGGGGPQTASGMRLWNDRVGLVGGVGPDFPPSAGEWLKGAGIDDQGLRYGELLTARAWQVMEASGLRTQVRRVDASVRRNQLGRNMENLPEAYRDAKGYHFGVHPNTPDYPFIENLRELGSVVSIESFCPAARQPKQNALNRLLQAADIFSLNEHEAVSLVGTGKPEELALRLVSAGAKLLCLRLGARGSLIIDGKNELAFHIPAIDVPVIDAVGAGNAYCGGFLVGWCESHKLEKAGVYGAVASSFMLEQIGSPVFSTEIFSKARKRVEMLRSKVRPVAI